MTTTEVKQKVRLGANYWRLWFASVTSNLGDGIAQIAYPWLASAVTRNALLISLIAVAQRLPWLVFTLPAGVLTDRHDRRTIIATSNAVRAALAIQEVLDGVEFGDGVAFNTRVGINTGSVVGGLVGSGDRVGYTVHGDDVNLAARLEALNKDYETCIIVAASTLTAARLAIPVRELGDVAVRGKSEKTTIFAIDPAVTLPAPANGQGV